MLVGIRHPRLPFGVLLLPCFSFAVYLLAWGTSLDYNFNTLGHVLTQDSPATDQHYTENPDFPGWVFDVVYEFKVDGALFAANGFGGLAVPVIHDSPNKIGKNKVYTQIDGVIPEPATIALLGFGSLACLRRKSIAAIR